ncbi:MAG: hypothetical protein GY842_10880, partial [bacterium]|nr:hypothetical protein [bacterium]
FNSAPSTGETLKVLFGDMNGNGTTDVVWLTTDYQLKYLDLLGHSNFGLLRQIDNSMGMVARMEYRSSTDYMVDAKLDENPWKTPLPISTPVISKITTTDSFDTLGLEANTSTQLIEYRDGYYDGVEREFRGFAKVTDTTVGDEFHPSGVTETWMHVGRNLETGEDEEILKGEAWLQKTEDAEGNVFSTVETTWERRWMCQGEFDSLSVRILPDCDPAANNDAIKDDLIA